MRRSADFLSTVRRGPATRRVARSTVVVHLSRPSADAPGAPAAPALVGVVVSRAVGPAVTRNLVKRRLRHALKEHVHRLPAGARLVVRALPPAADAAWPALRAEIGSALERALEPAPHRVSPARRSGR